MGYLLFTCTADSTLLLGRPLSVSSRPFLWTIVANKIGVRFGVTSPADQQKVSFQLM